MTTLTLHADAVEPEQLAMLADGVQHNKKLRALELGQTALTGRAGLPIGPPSLARPHAHATRDPLVFSKVESHGDLAKGTVPRDTHGLVALCRALRCGGSVLFADLTDCAVGEAGGGMDTN